MSDYLAELITVAGAEAVLTGDGARQRASKDFAWLSPILARELPTVVADVVVRPHSTSQIPDILSVAYRHQVPVVARGRGTGNYGQAAPLRGGIVLDVSGCRTVLSLDADTVTVEAGCAFDQLEDHLAAFGREVAVLPSTTNSTVAGFLSGGNQGIGSIEHGSIWDGWVHRLTVVGCVERPVPREVSGEDLGKYLHAFGTTSVITEVTLQHFLKRDRTSLFAAFTGLRTATAAGRQLMDLPKAPRAVSVDDQSAYQHYPSHPGMSGVVLLRAILDIDQVDAAQAIVSDAGGQVTSIDPEANGLISRSVYNHATLAVRRRRPEVCAVQIRGDAVVEREDEVRKSLPEVSIHLDGNAPKTHGKGFSGLLFSTWVDDATLHNGMTRLRELGVKVVNPHTWLVGSHGGLERYWAASKDNDPQGLLNPGKLPVPVH